jgi:hypothetical protein
MRIDFLSQEKKARASAAFGSRLRLVRAKESLIYSHVMH